MEVETSTVLSSTTHDTLPHQPVDDDTKRMLIAPLVIPSRSPKPSSLPTTTAAEKPSLLTCYAGLFARLPSLGQIMNSQFAHAQELYNHLFAPSTPVADPDNPNPAFHHSARQGILLPLFPVLSPTSLTPLSISPHLWQTLTTCHAPPPPQLTLSNPPTQQPASTFNFAPFLQFLTNTIIILTSPILSPNLPILALLSSWLVPVRIRWPVPPFTPTWSAHSPLYRVTMSASYTFPRI